MQIREMGSELGGPMVTGRWNPLDFVIRHISKSIKDKMHCSHEELSVCRTQELTVFQEIQLGPSHESQGETINCTKHGTLTERDSCIQYNQ